MLRVEIQTTVDLGPSLVKALRELTRHEVLVGFLAETDPARSDTEQTNASLAYIHEFGSPAHNIPPRPFLLPGVESVSDAITEEARTAALSAIDGNRAGMTHALEDLGRVAQRGVERHMTNASFVPLAPATLRARRAAGIASTQPLVATGQMRGAVDWKVRRKGR
jgi:hypothetical protein